MTDYLSPFETVCLFFFFPMPYQYLLPISNHRRSRFLYQMILSFGRPVKLIRLADVPTIGHFRQRQFAVFA